MKPTRRLAPILALANLVGEPKYEAMTARELRRQLALFTLITRVAAGRSGAVEVTDLELELPGRTLAARAYRGSSAGSDARPLVVFFHGGGWVGGGLSSHDAICRRFATAARAVVVAVDYRLAPEHRFPAAADDAVDAARVLVPRAAELGADARTVFVMGDSAGGNLAAIVARRIRDEGGPSLAGQILIYPVASADFETSSYRECANGFGLSRDRMRFFWDQYVPEPTQRTDPRVALLAADLRGLPPALVITAGLDVLRDEGRAYATALERAGVPVEVHEGEGMIHGYVSLPGLLPEAARALETISGFVDRRRSR